MDLVFINLSLVCVDWIGKIGIINEDENMWFMLLILRLILGGWLGYDDNCLMVKGVGYYWNVKYMVYLVNVI